MRHAAVAGPKLAISICFPTPRCPRRHRPNLFPLGFRTLTQLGPSWSTTQPISTAKLCSGRPKPFNLSLPEAFGARQPGRPWEAWKAAGNRWRELGSPVRLLGGAWEALWEARGCYSACGCAEAGLSMSACAINVESAA